MNVSPEEVCNHETWLVASWLFSSEKELNKWSDLITQLVNLGNTKDITPLDQFVGVQMHAFYTKKMDEFFSGPGMFLDLLSHSMNNVKWDEVARLVIDSHQY